MLALVGVGTVTIWSSGNAREVIFHGMWKNNLSTAVFGLVLYFVLAKIDYRRFLSLFSWPLYGGALVMLVAVNAAFGLLVPSTPTWRRLAVLPLMAAVMALPLIFTSGAGMEGSRSLGVTLLGGYLAYAFVGVPIVMQFTLRRPPLNSQSRNSVRL